MKLTISIFIATLAWVAGIIFGVWMDERVAMVLLIGPVVVAFIFAMWLVALLIADTIKEWT